MDTGNNSTLRIIPVREQDFGDEVVWSDLFSVRKMIPLESRDDVLIHSIYQVEFCDDRIFIRDKKSCKLFIFDSDGKFVNEIGVRGKGPGEFVYMGGFAIDADKDLIYIVNSSGSDIPVFNYAGEYIKSFERDRYYESIGMTSTIPFIIFKMASVLHIPILILKKNLKKIV